MTIYKSIAEYSTLSAEQFFEQIAPSQKPIVIRGFAKNWPLVVAAEQAPSDFSAYLNKFYNGNKTAMVVAPPSANKRFYYRRFGLGPSVRWLYRYSFDGICIYIHWVINFVKDRKSNCIFNNYTNIHLIGLDKYFEIILYH